MSALESMIWTVLGYLAMPTIFIIGFTGVAAVSLFVLKMLGAKSIHSKI
ncbi:TIGR02808 family protein [Pseudoalteromonas sp. NBT06-2]|nr:TIGR02808 family protein [Pseudoalteromonas sp. NBT06-2]PAJ73079.1 TIGR02808 family protein [Pseudoalteromonas sp. NBT06-2]